MTASRMTAKVEKQTSIAGAYEAIREMILQGRLAPGSRLVERDLAEHLGISRSPIRSVLLRLYQEGYLRPSSSAKRARLSVAPLTKADAVEVFGIVGFLDAMAARHAASQDEVTRGRLADDLDGVNRGLSAISDASPFDARAFFDLDIRFHRLYLDLLPESRTRSLYESLRPQAERYRIGYINSVPDGYAADVMGEHEAIVQAIRSGDAEAASGAALQNWKRARDRICTLMDVAGERGAW